MIYVIIGASCSGKTTFISNTWNVEEGVQRKDILSYTELPNAILFGKYDTMKKTRIVGCDKLPRTCFVTIGEQLNQMKDLLAFKDVVLDGDKITYAKVMDSVLSLGVDVTLILITCSKEISISRNKEHGFTNERNLKSVHTKAVNLYLRYKDKVNESHLVFTDDFTRKDFENFSLKTLKQYEYEE